MSKQGSSRKSLIIGIIAAVVVLGVLLAVLLTQCTGNQNATESTPAQTTEEAVPTYELYWNLDRAVYDGKSEAGMSSRQQESDGYFHIRFFFEGEVVELRAADRKVINAIDVNDVMGLEFDSNGIITGVTVLDDMPLEQVGWQFYVQSVGGKLLKLNSSKAMNGLEVMLDIHDFTGIWDMTGLEGEVGMSITPIAGDRVIAIANLAGELTHVYVYERPEYMKTFTAYCEHCKKDAEWKMWTKTSELPSDEGHYQLQNNISGMSKQQYINEDQKVCLDLNGMQVDGKDNARVYTLHYPSAHLAIMDTSEGQTGVLRGHSTASDQGGVVWVRYGQFHLYSGTLDGSDMVCKLNGAAIDIPKGAFMYMYGGKIIGGTAKAVKNDKGNWTNGIGGTMVVRGKFVMYDGIIEGGKATGVVTKYNADGTPNTYARGYAGNIYVGSGGVVEMNGGTIKGGTATHSGGNIYVDGTGEFTMNGGTIVSGRVTGKGRNGGNVFVSAKSTFTLKSGLITDGISYNCGANLYTNGKVVMTGGTIRNGKIYNWSTRKLVPTENRANVFSVQGDFYLYGGRIEGSFYAIDTAVDNNPTIVYLTTNARIYGEEGAQCGDMVLAAGGDGVTCRVGKLREAAKIGVTATTGIFTLPTDESNADNFFSNIDDAEICYVDNCIALGRFSCLCGNNENGKAHYGECDGAKLFWGPLTGVDMPKVTGNYYIPRVKDESGNLVPRTINCKEQSSMAEGAEIKLDLNGGTLLAKEHYRFFSLHNPNTFLTITDSSEGKTGVVKSRGQGTTQGNVIWVRYGRFDLYGGTLDGSAYTLHQSWEVGTDGLFGTADDKLSDRDGGTICMGGSTTFNMWGGTVIGNQMKGKELTKTVKTTEIVDGEEVTTSTEVKRTVGTNGGASLYIPGKAIFNMYGGEIRDGYSADRGGNIQIYGGGNANLYGGVIKNGKTDQWGGNIHMDGASILNIDGVTISGGESKKNGGSIYSGNSNATINIISGLIENGKTTADQGGNIFNSGYLNITGGTITGGRVEANKNGGNIAINSSRDIVITGGTISNGYSNGTGGNIGVSSTNTAGSLTIGGTAVITGGYAKNNGGNIFVQPNNANKNNPNVHLTITGGTISNGEAVNDGGNIYLGANGEGVAQATVTGGTITGGLAKTGGNIRVNGAAADFVVDGANVLIEKGTTNNSGHGGNVNTSGSFTLANGIIRDGVSVNTAGNVYISGSGKLVVLGGKILGGTDKNGANAVESSVYSVCAGLEIRGGEMDGGICIINYGNNNGWVKMSGNPVIKSSTRAGLTLNWSSSPASHVPYIDIDEPMVDGAEVYLNCTKWEVGPFTTETEEGYAEYFVSQDTSRQIGYVNGKLALGKVHCLCGSTTETHKLGCNGEQLFWQPWSSSSKLPSTSGNYYIHPSVTVTLTEQWKPAADAVINLDLNGRTLTNQYRVFAITNANTNLTITDTVGTGKIYKTGTYSGQGGILWISGGSTVKMIAGTIDGTEYTNGSNGGAVCIEGTGSKFYMYGGTIKGTGSATNGGNVALKGTNCEMHMYGGSIEGGRAYETGGNIYCSSTNSSLYIYGGTISGGMAGKDYVSGSAKNGWGGNIEIGGSTKVYISGGTITGGRTTGNGGNIRISGENATLDVTGGKITDGRSGDNGGNIFIQGATSLANCEISDGYAPNGGNICMNSYSNKNLTLDGVTIKNGSCTGEGANLRIFNNAATTVTIKGGTTISGGTTTNASKKAGQNVNISVACTVNFEDCQIDGYVNITNASATINVTGKTIISGGETNLTLGGAKLNLTDLHEDALIGINYAAGGEFTTATKEEYKANFTSDDTNMTIEFVEGKMVLALGKYYCLCGSTTDVHELGCDGTEYFWQPWNSTSTLPTAEGYWYLTKEVTINSGNWAIGNATVAIDLNGQTIKNGEGKNLRFFRLDHADTHLIITDTAGDGKIVNNGTYTQGMIAWINTAGSEMTLIKGTLDISGASAGSYHYAPNAIDLVNAGCTFTMYGGTILGGPSAYGGSAVAGENWDSRFVMYGGTITGHADEQHATIRLFGTKNVISGGTITGGVEINRFRFDAETTNSASHLTLKGNPSIDSLLITDETDKLAGYGNYLVMPLVTIEGKLQNTTPIKLSVLGNADYVFTANTVDAANASKFVAANAGQSVLYIEDGASAGKLYIGKARCICGATDGNHLTYTDPDGKTVGCDGKLKPFMAWTSTTSLPTETGYWYLTENVSYTTQASLGKNANVILDLNGKTVQAAQVDGADANTRVYSIHNPGAKLTITDSVGGGKIIGSATKNDQGNVVWVRRDSTWNADDNIGTFTLLGGTLQGNNPDCTKNGGVVNINSYGHFYMLGGTIQDGTANWAGNVMIDDYVEAYLVGGTIKNGTAKAGAGNVCIDPGCTIIIDGITLEGGETVGNGGSLYIAKNLELTIKDSTITGGQANGHGGNIFMASGSNITITDSEIADGVVIRTTSGTAEGGNIKVDGATLTLNDTTVADGTGYALNADGTPNYGTSSDKKSWGGNIHVGNSGTLTINKGTVISGGYASGNGGNLNVAGTLNITGGEIKDGESKFDRGGNIWMGSGSLNITGGTISGGKAGGDRGGNIHANANATLNMTGGTITGGSVKDSKINASANINWEGGSGKVTFGGTAKIDGYVFIRNTSTVIELSGKPVISGGSTNLYTANNITVGTLESGAKIGINRDPGVFTTNTVDASYASYFTADKANTDVAAVIAGTDAGKLAIGNVYAACGLTEEHEAHDYCDGKTHTWVVWAAANKAMPKNTDTDRIGYWYLAENMVVNNTTTIGSGETGRQVYVNTNGKNITLQFTTGAASRMYSTSGLAGGTLKLVVNNLDTTKSTIIVDDSKQVDDRGGDEGRVIWLNGGNVSAYVDNIDIDLTGAKTDLASGARETKDGIAFTVGNGRKLYLSDVNITGGSAQGAVILVHDKGVLSLHNTVITGHTGSANGGGVLVKSNTSGNVATLTLSGKTVISGCKKLDGTDANITLQYVPTFTVTDSYVASTTNPQGIDAPVDTVILNNAVNGSFKADDADKQVAFTAEGMKLVSATAHVHCACGGTIASGTVLANGETHICKDIVYTELTSTGGKLTADAAWYVPAGETVTLTATIDQDQYDLDLCLNGGKIATTNGTSVVNVKGNELTITTCDATYTDGDKTENVLTVSGMSGGTYGAVAMESGSRADFFRGTIDATDRIAHSSKHGAAVSARGGVFVQYPATTIYGGTVRSNSDDNTGRAHGGSVFVGNNGTSTGTYHMLGGTIKGGTTFQYGGNVYVMQGTFYMYDGLITGGKKADAKTVDSVTIDKNGIKSSTEANANSNVTVREKSQFIMSGGQVTGGSSGTNSNNTDKSLYPKFILSGSAKFCKDVNNLRGNNLWVSSTTVIEIDDLNSDAAIGLMYTSANLPTYAVAKYTGTGTLNLDQLGIYMFALKDDTTRTFGLELNSNNEVKVVETTGN